MGNETNNPDESKRYTDSPHEAYIRLQVSYPDDYATLWKAAHRDIPRILNTINDSARSLATAIECGWLSDDSLLAIREALFRYDQDRDKGDTPV